MTARLIRSDLIFTPKNEWYPIPPRSRLVFRREVSKPHRFFLFHLTNLMRGLKLEPVDRFGVELVIAVRLQIGKVECFVDKSGFPLIALLGQDILLPTANVKETVHFELWNPTPDQMLLSYLRLEGCCAE